MTIKKKNARRPRKAAARHMFTDVARAAVAGAIMGAAEEIVAKTRPTGPGKHATGNEKARLPARKPKVSARV